MNFKVMKNLLAVAGFAMVCSNAFAQGYPQNLVSKAPSGTPVFSGCPAGKALNGVFFTHPMGQDYTYQESFAALCITIPQQAQVVNYPVAKTPALPQWTTQSAPAGGYLTGIGFSHNPGQNFTYQESVTTTGISMNRPVYVGANCRNVASDRGPVQLWLTCSPSEVVTSISFGHPYGQDLVYQETVSLTCCPVQ